MFLDYLRSRLKQVFMLILVAGIFASSYLLFDLHPVTVLYPAALSAAFILTEGILDYRRTAYAHRQLKEGCFPETKDLIERDYQEIIRRMKEDEDAQRRKAASDYSNMVEYYTVWAHQIKTPIASMRLSIQSEDTDLARRLDVDLNRIEAYVEMVMTFLRLDSDSTDYVIREIRLDDVIRPAIRRFSRDFISKKLTLDFQPTEAVILSDEKWLAFVLEQVISNAVKYTNSGGVRIRMDEPGILCIEDTGIGISPEDLPRVFENGYTGFIGREDRRASGIGLYLCRRICGRLGHGIRAESVPGAGTRILLDLNTHPVGIE